MEEWGSGEVEEWRSGGVEEWRSGGVEKWRSGIMHYQWPAFNDDNPSGNSAYQLTVARKRANQKSDFRFARFSLARRVTILVAARGCARRYHLK